MAELKPIIQKNEQVRPYGLCKGEFEVPQSFFDQLPDDVLKTFETPLIDSSFANPWNMAWS